MNKSHTRLRMGRGEGNEKSPERAHLMMSFFLLAILCIFSRLWYSNCGQVNREIAFLTRSNAYWILENSSSAAPRILRLERRPWRDKSLFATHTLSFHFSACLCTWLLATATSGTARINKPLLSSEFLWIEYQRYFLLNVQVWRSELQAMWINTMAIGAQRSAFIWGLSVEGHSNNEKPAVGIQESRRENLLYLSVGESRLARLSGNKLVWNVDKSCHLDCRVFRMSYCLILDHASTISQFSPTP